MIEIGSALIMTMPKLNPETRTIRLHVAAPIDLKDAYQELCRQRHTDMSTELRSFMAKTITGSGLTIAKLLKAKQQRATA